MDNFRYLKFQDVQKLLGVSRSTVMRMVGQGRLPKPLKIGERFVAWRSDEVQAILSTAEVTPSRYAAPEGRE